MFTSIQYQTTAAGRDDVLVEQLKHLGQRPINGNIQCSTYASQETGSSRYGDNPRLSPYLIKPGRLRDSEELQTIPLLCHTYKLYKRMLLNRIAPVVKQRLIKEQAGFRTGKSCTSQLLNLTQHIEDGYQRGMITGVAFVDLSAAYDTVNHRILIQKTQDSLQCRVIQNMQSSRRFYVELNNECSRWSKQKNDLLQGSVLSPILFNIYTNDQPLHNGTCSFIYADDLCVTAQQPSFIEVETTIEESHTILQIQQSACKPR